MTTEAYVQPRRSDFGRGKVFYSPKAVQAEIAAIIRKSPLFAEFSHEVNPETQEEFVREHAVQSLGYFAEGGRGMSSDSFYMEVRRTWSVEATLHVNRRMAWHNGDPTVLGPNDQVLRIYPANYEVTVSWSSTSRHIASAQASIALYQEMTNLAAVIASKVEEYDGNIADLIPQT